MVFPTVVQLHKARFGCLLSLTAPSCPHPALGFWVWKQDAVCGEEQGGSPCAGRLWNPPSCKSVLRMVQGKQQKHQHPLQCPALCSEHPVAVSPSVTQYHPGDRRCSACSHCSLSSADPHNKVPAGMEHFLFMSRQLQCH